jgi:SAM-dependent methyltransferase
MTRKMNENNDIFDQGYKLFEDRFRGSEAAIRRRLALYLPLIAGVSHTAQNNRKALDLGSGRGEWLALISEHGWSGTGVEPNSIAEAAQGIDAEIVKADALDFLRGCGDRSFGLVTAFHVVEHLETSYLLQMLREIRRVLTPGGLLILETPNPENLTVGTWSFYLDPSHKAPIPPVLLQYHAEAAGFLAPEIVRLNGSHEDRDLGPLSVILSVLFRSGPDFAVVARNPGTNDEPFAALIKNFASQHSQRNPADIQTLIELAKHTDNVIASHTKAINEQLSMLQSALDQKNQELAAVYNSSSWKISRPLRTFTLLVRNLPLTLRHGTVLTLSEARKRLRKHPRTKVFFNMILPFLPRRFARLGMQPPSIWFIDADSRALAYWKMALMKEEAR